jgi:hypothetical protein
MSRILFGAALVALSDAMKLTHLGPGSRSSSLRPSACWPPSTSRSRATGCWPCWCSRNRR